MNNRQRAMAILKYQKADRLPLVHFAFWEETLAKWLLEGHLTQAETRDHNAVGRKLGFDFDWFTTAMPVTGMNPFYPPFERRVVEELPDGSRKILDEHGVVILQVPGATGIPPEFDHLLKDRASWEEHFLPRLQFCEERLDRALLGRLKDDTRRDQPIGIYCGSLLGDIRSTLGLVGLSYLTVDDPGLLEEIIDVMADLNYQVTEAMLKSGAKFDFGHFWEDICYNRGPLVNPAFFKRKLGPHYRRFTGLLQQYSIDIVSLDCDGKIDALIPTWLENGVNTMFPIEVGTWGASIGPWREKYGRQIRGVGGTDKRAFSTDYKAVDAEIERLRPLVALGGYIPCPDHRLPPDAKWENVQYYCERMRRVFG
jgi:uroporphyrinogen decarboxylase